MRRDGEPIGQGQLDRGALSRRALRACVLFAAAFGLVVLVNGLLLIALIGLCVEAGWCEVALPATEEIAGSPSAWLRALNAPSA